MKKRITQDDYIKANRKASREAEIEMYDRSAGRWQPTLFVTKGCTSQRKYITVKR